MDRGLSIFVHTVRVSLPACHTSIRNVIHMPDPFALQHAATYYKDWGLRAWGWELGLEGGIVSRPASSSHSMQEHIKETGP
jgi:hypothetical protein